MMTTLPPTVRTVLSPASGLRRMVKEQAVVRSAHRARSIRAVTIAKTVDDYVAGLMSWKGADGPGAAQPGEGIRPRPRSCSIGAADHELSGPFLFYQVPSILVRFTRLGQPMTMPTFASGRSSGSGCDTDGCKFVRAAPFTG